MGRVEASFAHVYIGVEDETKMNALEGAWLRRPWSRPRSGSRLSEAEEVQVYISGKGP